MSKYNNLGELLGVINSQRTDSKTGHIYDIECHRDELENTLLYFCENLSMNWFIDLIVEDQLAESNKFKIKYILENLEENIVFCAWVSCDEEDIIPSMANIWKNAYIHEQEAHELFGVRFNYEISNRR